jgi:precorrin-6B methylase 2
MAIIIGLIAVVVILGISVSWTNFWGAPWVPTSMSTVHKMLRLADLKPDELIYDLGCGDGRIIVTAALQYRARAVGLELDPLRFIWCQLIITLFGLRSRVQIIQGDFFEMDLSEADVVACYLLPDTNKKLEKKLLQELKPGTRVVSNTFLFPNIQQARKNGKARLYIFSPENTIQENITRQLKDSLAE